MEPQEVIVVLGNPDIKTCKNRVEVALQHAERAEYDEDSEIILVGDESEVENMLQFAGDDWKIKTVINDKVLNDKVFNNFRYKNIEIAFEYLEKEFRYENIVVTICTSKYHSSKALIMALREIKFHGMNADVQIIHDIDEGDNKRCKEEERDLIFYVELLVKECNPYR